MSDQRLRELEREAVASGEPEAELRFLRARFRTGDRGSRVWAPGRGSNAKLIHLWSRGLSNDTGFVCHSTAHAMCHRVKKRGVFGLLKELDLYEVSNSHRYRCSQCVRFAFEENDPILLHELDVRIRVLEIDLM